MDTLGAFESYVSAVQSGSLSGAARQRRMSQPAISQQISALESQLDTRLLVRNRSGVRMTRSGELLYKHALVILDEQKRLKASLENLAGKVAGRLSITVNLALSQRIMGDVIVDLAKRHPDLKIDLRADDRILDLEAENIDLALRTCKTGDGTGFVRKIGTVSMLPVATPAYLDKIGRPTAPEGLRDLDFIQYRLTDDQLTTPLVKGDAYVEAPLKVGITAQFPDLILQALYSHLGYSIAPEFAVADEISKGALEVVLPAWSIPEKPLYLVYPSRETLSPGLQALLGCIIAKLAETKGITLIKNLPPALRAKSAPHPSAP